MKTATQDRSATLLASLASLSTKTDAAQVSILKAAKERMGVVQKRMESLAPAVLTKHGAEDEYKTLSLELHKLQVVIAQSS